MLEHSEYKGHLYGTSVDSVNAVLKEGKICVLDLEPQVCWMRGFLMVTLRVELSLVALEGVFSSGHKKTELSR